MDSNRWLIILPRAIDLVPGKKTEMNSDDIDVHLKFIEVMYMYI